MSNSSHCQTARRPYFQLHFLVLILAFTAVLGRLISLPAPQLVAWRTGLAVLVMAIWLACSRTAPLHLAARDRTKALAVGLILGLHWITFFGSIQLSNISICLAGMASTSFFTSLTEPLIDRRKPCIKEILLGIMVIPGLALVVGATWNHLPGLLCALASAFLAALFPVLNRKLTLRGLSPSTLTLHELASACLVSTAAAYLLTSNSDSALAWVPAGLDWLWLALLAIVCTVWAFAFQIHLLRYFSAFTSSLAINFEPVYGILLAALIFREHREVSWMFYLGALFIVLANVLHAIISQRTAKTPTR